MKKALIIMMSALSFAACAPKSGAPALDLTDLDTTVSPKADFYQYATGGWQVKNPLKPEFSRYGSFDALREQAQENLNALFQSMTSTEAAFGTVDQKISDLYKMAMDSTTRNELGAQPLQPYIAEIQTVQSKEELATLLGKMNLYGDGGFFGAGVEADLTNSDLQVLYLGQGGLGMGDRDYYLLESNKAPWPRLPGPARRTATCRPSTTLCLPSKSARPGPNSALTSCAKPWALPRRRKSLSSSLPTSRA